jgi:hypothetical protein
MYISNLSMKLTRLTFGDSLQLCKQKPTQLFLFQQLLPATYVDR